MLTNKEAGLLEPDEDVINFIKNQEKENLAEQIENIGWYIESLIPITGNVNDLWTLQLTQEELIRKWSDIYYLTNYLRTLAVDKCDPPLKNALELRGREKTILQKVDGESLVIDNVTGSVIE
jgi:hypothetical protein